MQSQMLNMAINQWKTVADMPVKATNCDDDDTSYMLIMSYIVELKSEISTVTPTMVRSWAAKILNIIPANAEENIASLMRK